MVMEISLRSSHVFCAMGQQDLFPLRREHHGHADLMTVKSKTFKAENLLWQTEFSATEIFMSSLSQCI